MDEIDGYLVNITSAIRYYATEGTTIDRVALPKELFDRGEAFAWPDGVTIATSEDHLIRYLSGETHVGTQRPA